MKDIPRSEPGRGIVCCVPSEMNCFPNSRAAQVLAETMTDMEKLERLFTEGVVAAGKATQNPETADRTFQKGVYAEGGVEKRFSYIGETKDGRPCYVSGFDDSVNIDERIKVFKDRIATIFNLGAVELKTDVKKIRILGDRFTAQKNIYGDSHNTPEEQAAKISSLYDLADILATATYDPTATNTEDSYANPNVKPKNKAHENVKYWYKFKNEIVFDGVPYTVTFNIRDKGKEQYQYLIEFKENKTPGLSNTAVKSLLRTDRMSYEDSIAQKPDSVNRKSSISEENSSDKLYSIDDSADGSENAADTNVGGTEETPFEKALRRSGLAHLIDGEAEAAEAETGAGIAKAAETKPVPTVERDTEAERRERIRDHEILADAFLEAAQSEQEFVLAKRYRQKAVELADAEALSSSYLHPAKKGLLLQSLLLVEISARGAAGSLNPHPILRMGWARCSPLTAFAEKW